MNDKPDPLNVILPGFSMFDAGDLIRATNWCVPRPKFGIDEVLAVYEEYVDRPLGLTPVPDRVARKAYRGHAADQLFGERRTATQWWQPAAKLIAIASYITKETARVTDDSVEITFGQFKMSASPQGCWLNTFGRLRQAACPPDDASSEALRLPTLVTNHPLGKALIAVRAPRPLLWAANSAIRAEQAGRMATIRPAQLGVQKYRMPTRRTKTLRPLLGRREAYARCEEILGNPGPGSHHELYMTAVPTIMRMSDFNDLVGPLTSNPDHCLTPYQCQKFSDFMEVKEREGSLELA